LVSLSSYLIVGDRWIYFGIVHFVAFAALFSRIIQTRIKSPIWLAALGGFAIFTGCFASNSALNLYPANIPGFTTRKPLTDDYVPIFPGLE
jgi:uncharacterized membrane protein